MKKTRGRKSRVRVPLTAAFRWAIFPIQIQLLDIKNPKKPKKSTLSTAQQFDNTV
jgi:hypothetical protein